MNIPTEELGLKDALVRAGLLDAGSAGRGRPSLKMQEDGKTLVAQGWHIKGLSVQTSSRPTAATAQTTEVVKAKSTGIADIGDARYGEDDWTWHTEDGTKVGSRTVCNGCHNSLTYHFCAQARVYLDYDNEVNVFPRRVAVRVSR